MGKAPIIAAAAFLAALEPALAADLLPPPAPVPAEVPFEEVTSGWYLRGDLTYVDFDRPKDRALAPPGLNIQPFASSELKDAWGLGLGLGYRINGFLRVDVTADHRFDADFKGLSSASAFQVGYSTDTARIGSSTVLANAYVDLGTWYGITPYVGVGAGFAENTIDGYGAQVTWLNGRPAPAPTYLPSKSKTNFAYALMAGASFDLGMGASLDAGYRFVDLGQVETGLDDFRIGTRLEDLQAHELRLGLRWQFAGNGPFRGRAPAGYSAPSVKF